MTGTTRERNRTTAVAVALSALRVPLLALAYVTISGVLVATGAAATFDEAWQYAADHSYVVLNLAVDLPCLAVLVLVLRREGRRLADLLGPDGVHLRRDLVRGAAVFAVMAAMFGLFPVLAEALTGADPYPAGITRPPLWVAVWTVTVFPLITAPTEELLFRGYALPHLHAAASRASTPRARTVGVAAAVVVTAVGFGAAHMLIPPVGGAASMITRGLTLTAIGAVLDTLRLRSPRLAPLIIGHALVDGVLIGSFTLLAAV